MIKRIIFDLDNTLIPWKDEYIGPLIETVKEYNVDIEPIMIDNIIESLENKYEKLSKQILLNDINETLNLNIDIKFIDTLFEKQKSLAVYDEELVNLLSYLSSKYELVVLTNYFKDIQSGRLQTAGILKYFKDVYGGDTFKVKPNKEAFINSSKPYNVSECIMIGDSIEKDYNAAINVGMKAILYDPQDKIKGNYNKIKSLSNLKQML